MHRFPSLSHVLIGIDVADLMLRKPRNARTDRLTDWRLFFQIYLVGLAHPIPLAHLLTLVNS